ncbi:inosine guanosine and [Jaminaea rosea]|uniref:Purine nucleoside phosphorylase n=1 Tax=Jaminaea rosea TaxID=1569628 RepID=A0A316UN34_9BASI|nr:inosine guanosine and [Jaminaea rosea]PWN26697.1 inosine guanosine and [Jaminaea rosea]
MASTEPQGEDVLALLPSEFKSAVEHIRSHLPAELARPKWGIICGSGLSTLSSSLTSRIEIPYSSIPGFSRSSVQGHGNALAFGFVTGGSRQVPVVAALGRFHLYEGHTPQQCVFPVRTMKALGIKALVVTNAAGSLSPTLPIGTIMALHDHLSLPTLSSPLNPLVGPNFPLGPRFPPTSNAYDTELRTAFFRSVASLGEKSLERTAEGTYAFVIGPTYESRAECRMLKTLGADVVGMSTVPEVIAARQCGVRVLALSLVTNVVVTTPYFDAKKAALAGQTGAEKVEKPDDDKEAANHEEVLAIGKERSEEMRTLVCKTILGVTDEEL